MYHWSILIITVAVTETVINLITGTLFFLPWFFVIGFRNGITDASGRGAYEWLLTVRESAHFPSRLILIHENELTRAFPVDV